MPLPTMTVKNGAGADATVNLPNSGRRNATDSQAVVLSNEDLATLASIVAKLPDLISGRSPVDVPLTASTTREYGPGYRASVTATATTFALSGNLTLGSTREIRVRPSTAIWLRFGTAGDQVATVPAPNGPAVSIPFDANTSEVVRVPANCTHISVIRDSADGNVTFTPAVVP